MKIGSKIRSVFFSHWLLKIVSLLLAFGLWFVVISTSDPVDEKRFQNIRVNLLNTELLTERGQMYEILDNTDVVRTVTFDAPNSVRREIQSSDIIAEADLANLTATDTVEIRFSCPKYSEQVQNISGNIEFVKLNIEKETRKTINIEYNTVGSVEENYMVGNVSLDRTRLEVQGPESAIEEIDRAVVDVDVTGITGTGKATGAIRLVDAEGSEVVRSSVSKNLESVTVTVEVWRIKEIPVLYSYSGTPAENCEMIRMETAVDFVQVAGPSEQIRSLTVLEVDPRDIDITEATGDYEIRVDLEEYLPKGIYFADENFDSSVTVKVLIEKLEEKRIALRAENIQVINVPEGVTYEIVSANSSALGVRGRAAYIALLQSSTLPGVVDVGAWIESSAPPQPLDGEYSLPVDVSLLAQQEKISTPAIVLRFTPIQDGEEHSEQDPDE